MGTFQFKPLQGGHLSKAHKNFCPVRIRLREVPLCFELGIFPFDSHVYHLTPVFNFLTLAFNLPIRTFDLETCSFSLLTHGFELVIREFEHVTHGFELVTHRFEYLTRGFELVTRRFEFVTHFSELATRNL